MYSNIVGRSGPFQECQRHLWPLGRRRSAKETARRLVSSARSYDYVGLFGGEEFLVTLNNCDPAFGLARAEKICKTIAERPVETSPGSVPISMSFAEQGMGLFVCR